MTKYLVIEPHADDAFLSLHAHIKQWVAQRDEVWIMTLYPETNRRIDEARAYAKSVGASSTSFIPPDAANLTIVAPLGIQHPEHVTAHRKWFKSASLFYLDMPYAIKQKNGNVLNNRLRYSQIESFIKPHASKWNSAKIFKSQAKFFHFNLEMLKGSFEMLVRK